MKRFLSGLAAAMLIAGCAVTPKQNPEIQHVVSHLDPDGMELSVMTAESWQITASRLNDLFNSALSESEITPAMRRNLLKTYTFVRLLLDLSGLEHIRAAGMSAKRINDNYIRNRLFFLTSPDVSSKVLNFTASGNTISPKDFLQSLPAGTKMALAAELDTQAIADALDAVGEARNFVLGMFPSQFPLKKFILNASGKWQIVITSFEPQAGYTEFPDPGNAFFNIIAGAAGATGSEPVTRVETGGTVYIKKGDRIRIYSHISDETYCQQAATLNITDPGILDGQPENCAIVYYSNLSKEQFVQYINGIGVKSIVSDVPVMFTLQKLPDGIAVCSNAGHGNLTELCTQFIDLAVSLFLQTNPGESDTEEENTSNTEESRTAGENDKVDCNCFELMKTVYQSMYNTAIEPGFYRMDGEKTIKVSDRKESEFFCFGKIESSVPAPWLVTASHGDAFCVCFADGSMECFTLSNPEMLRRIVGFLQTIRNYDEKVFIKLIGVADRFDR